MDKLNESSKSQLEKLGITYKKRIRIPEDKLESSTDVQYIKENVEITDKDELVFIRKYSNKNKVLPDDVITKVSENVTGFGVVKYFYKSKFEYFKEVELNQEEIDLNIKLKDTRLLRSISYSLLFFVSLTVIGMIISIVAITDNM